jgi:hypothetical protein
MDSAKYIADFQKVRREATKQVATGRFGQFL